MYGEIEGMYVGISTQARLDNNKDDQDCEVPISFKREYLTVKRMQAESFRAKR